MGETAGTLALSGADLFAKNGAPQKSGTDDILEVSGDLAAENVAQQPRLLKESVPGISCQPRRCGNKKCVGARSDVRK